MHGATPAPSWQDWQDPPPLALYLGAVPTLAGSSGNGLVRVRWLALGRRVWGLAGSLVAGSVSQADDSAIENDVRRFEVVVRSLNGELARFQAVATDFVWDVKIELKRRTGIPVHQQVLCLEAARLHGGQRLFDLLVGETMTLSLVRVGAACGQCRVPMTRGRFCSGCLEALYCNRECQRLHWAAHRASCCAAQLEA
mgnify:CR=1 FL=1